MLELAAAVAALKDSRQKARISTATVAWNLLVMLMVRLGSLNALEQLKAGGCCKRLLGTETPSADTLGRVLSLMNPADLRSGIRQVYSRAKRMKALPPLASGLVALIVDGHESSSSFKCQCAGCLTREITKKNGTQTQYYHRLVLAQLVTGEVRLLLDVEPQRKGEDEVATALRLLERILAAYPRAFDVVLADALYADPRFFNFLINHGKHALSVLKANQPTLLEDALSLFDSQHPQTIVGVADGCLAWDSSGFTTWPQVNARIRIVRTLDSKTTRRHLTKTDEPSTSHWLWVTTLPQHCVPTETIIRLGHARWDIENQGFNELASRWHFDHIYKHQPNAILCAWLLTLLAANLFFLFYRRNLKPIARDRLNTISLARLLLADLLARDSSFHKPRPP